MINYTANYKTINLDDPELLEKIFKMVLGEDLDPFDISKQLVDCLVKTFPCWWETKVRNEQTNLRRYTLQPYLTTCEKCGKTNCETELHHIISPYLLGGNEKENLLILCHDCHKETMKKEVK